MARQLYTVLELYADEDTHASYQSTHPYRFVSEEAAVRMAMYLYRTGSCDGTAVHPARPLPPVAPCAEFCPF